MRTIIVFTVLSILVLAVTTSANEQGRPGLPHNDFFEITGECVPNQQFYDKCNSCKCGPDGKTAGCTLMACPEPQNPRIDGYTTGRKCPAGQTFHDKCNTCKCGADGHSAACTLMLCPGDQ